MVLSTQVVAGQFSLVTYNTAGLPPFINLLDSVRHYKIGQLLSNYDIALVQEDFFYHGRLSKNIQQPYRTRLSFFHTPLYLWPRWRLAPDGLHRFANFPFALLERHTWQACNGLFDHANDCLAAKGFSVATHEFGGNVAIDIFNLHMDAGNSPLDYAVRAEQMAQLTTRIMQSLDMQKAVIAVGDWNLRRSDTNDVTLLDQFIVQTGLTDVSQTLAQRDAFLNEIDRVFFRSSPNLTLTPQVYRNESELFRNAVGADLSDHPPISVDFIWE